jgi:transposase
VPQNFIPCDRDQSMLMPPDLREWLPADHLVWFVIDSIKQLDLGVFYRRHRADGWGRAAYDPAMMVTLLLYAYAVGVRSARDIERRTAEDIAFRVITANRRVDHATICRFIARHREALAELFVSVLGLCADAGMVRPGVVAIDGTKIGANASAMRNVTREQLEDFARKVFDEVDRINAEEDELYGDKRGDEIPKDLIDQAARIEWLKRKLAEHQAAAGTKRPSRKTARVNTTDPDSAMQKTPQGYTQGYNGQVAVTQDQIIVAADLTADNNDSTQLQPMIAQAKDNLDAATAQRIGTVVADAGYFGEDNVDLELGVDLLIAPVATRNLYDAIVSRTHTKPVDEDQRRRWELEYEAAQRRADRRAALIAAYVAGHVTRAEVAQALEISVNTVIWLTWHLQKFGRLPRAHLPPPPRRPGARQVMLERFAEPGAREIYAIRARTVEPVIGQIKEARGMRRFLHRGRLACHCELRMMAAGHNLRKLWSLVGRDLCLYGRDLTSRLGPCPSL